MTKKEFMHKVVTATIQALQFVYDQNANEPETIEQLQKQLDEKVNRLKSMNEMAVCPEAANDPENMVLFGNRRQQLVEGIAELTLRIKTEDVRTPVKISQFGVEQDTHAFVFILSDDSTHKIPTVSPDEEFDEQWVGEILFTTAEYISKVIAAYQDVHCEFCPANLNPLLALILGI